MGFSEVVEAIYDAGVDMTGWQSALGTVGRHCAARSALLMVRDHASGAIEFALEHGLTRMYRSTYLQRFRGDDLRLRDLLGQPVGAIRTDTMIADYDAYTRSPAYRQLYRRLGTEHALGGFVHDDGERRFAIRVFRSCADGAFSAREIERFRRLVPHLARALRVAQQVSRGEAIGRILEWLVELSSAPACVLTTDGVAVAATGPGERLLETDGAVIRAALARLRAGGIGLDAERAPALRLRLSDGRTALLLLTGLRSEHRVPGLDAPLALLVVQGRLSADALAQAAARTYRLTPAETRLVRMLCAGASLTEAARRIGVGRETAKTQLRSVFQKTNVNRQRDLLQRIASHDEH